WSHASLWINSATDGSPREAHPAQSDHGAGGTTSASPTCASRGDSSLRS
ncbi:MAG: hypothetical protein AVDCRST_MAG87-2739, partial [uncultured Thermomicrobiales bacterium]